VQACDHLAHKLLWPHPSADLVEQHSHLLGEGWPQLDHRGGGGDNDGDGDGDGWWLRRLVIRVSGD